MNYKLSVEVANDLEKIWFYTFKKWSLEQADRHLNQIFDEFKYLCLNPKSGLDYGNIREGYFRTKVKSHLSFIK